MPDATFKDFCLDASDAAVLSRFWAQVLGSSAVTPSDRTTRLDPPAGRPESETLWINPVPEARTGPTRVHLDLRLTSADPQPLLDAGATVVRPPGEDHWWVLADPEGNEFCGFPPRDDPPVRITPFELIVSCRDSMAQAEWWAARTGGTAHDHPDKAFSWVEGTAGFPWEYWVFTEVPNGKIVKNRMHWDTELAGPDPQPLLDAGATVLREPGGDTDWWLMADPEGNEFCAFAPED